MKLGYARVSTTDQDFSIQRDRLYAADCEKLFEEKTSAVRKKRPTLERLLADDVVVVPHLDRLARSTVIRAATLYYQIFPVQPPPSGGRQAAQNPV